MGYMTCVPKTPPENIAKSKTHTTYNCNYFNQEIISVEEKNKRF